MKPQRRNPTRQAPQPRPARLGRLQRALARAFLPLSLGLLGAAAVPGRPVTG